MWVKSAIALIAGYLLGSIPVGLWMVKLIRRRDITKWYSGRTGATNVMRVAGVWAGAGTVIADVLKAAAAVWVARSLTGGEPWIEAVSGALAILGHNYSIFLLRREDGKIRLRGGAGGASSFGAAVGLWAPSGAIILPLVAAIYYGIGYASVTTLSVSFLAGIIFAVRAALGLGPWAYVGYAILVELLVIWALRPNIARLFKGDERLVGWRARRRIQEENLKSRQETE
ncbi:MAG: glycerol-3-phosphate acyltransferase [Anaerolineales bacterium]|nr:glycerol-3-phosphate acyltransferase [Anaerolineales bacterium]